MPISSGEHPNSITRSRHFKQRVPATGGVTRLLATNGKRIGATIFNHSNSTLYIDFSATVSEEDFWVALLPNALYELPYAIGDEVFGAWEADTAIGEALIRDFIEV